MVNGWRENKSVSETGFLPVSAWSKVFAIKAKLPVVLYTLYMGPVAPKPNVKYVKQLSSSWGRGQRTEESNSETINSNSYNWSSHSSSKVGSSTYILVTLTGKRWPVRQWEGNIGANDAKVIYDLNLSASQAN